MEPGNRRQPLLFEAGQFVFSSGRHENCGGGETWIFDLELIYCAFFHSTLLWISNFLVKGQIVEKKTVLNVKEKMIIAGLLPFRL